MSTATFTARLDAVPLNRFHWKLLIVSGLGWMFDAMDVILVAFLLRPITTEFGLDPQSAGLLAAATPAGMFLGAAVAGRLADRYGRKTIFQATLLVFSVGTLLSAIAPSFELLLPARILAGIGLGGELPVVATLVSEFSPRASRGRMIVLLESFWAYGTIAAGLIAVLVVPAFGALGWRAAFLVGALPAVYIAYLRRALPESPRYLASRGRANEADAVVRQVERAGGAPLITVARSAPPAPPARAVGIRDLWAPSFARRTLMLWVLWFGIVFTYYGIFLWAPTILAARGMTVQRSNEFFFLSTIAQIPGYFSAAWLVERWGRKPTLVTYLVGTAVSAWFFGNAGTDLTAFLWISLLSFFNLGAWGIVYTYSPELYPTAIRATGAGAAASVGRIGGIIGPFLTPVLVPLWGATGVFAMFMALLLVTALNVFLLAEETRGRSLEELGEAQVATARRRHAARTSSGMTEREDEHDRSAEHDLTKRGTEGQPPGPPVTPRASPYDRLPDGPDTKGGASGED